MSKEAFTPGPWGLEKAVEIWIKAGPLHVATVPRAKDGDWSPANAHLIAAAPEMYEALDLFVDWMNEEEGAHALCDKARAALKKARGEA